MVLGDAGTVPGTGNAAPLPGEGCTTRYAVPGGRSWARATRPWSRARVGANGNIVPCLGHAWGVPGRVRPPRLTASPPRSVLGGGGRAGPGRATQRGAAQGRRRRGAGPGHGPAARRQPREGGRRSGLGGRPQRAAERYGGPGREGRVWGGGRGGLGAVGPGRGGAEGPGWAWLSPAGARAVVPATLRGGGAPSPRAPSALGSGPERGRPVER